MPYYHDFRKLIIEGAFQASENILGVIAIAAIAVGALGISCLIWFRNSSIEKSQVIVRIMGMEIKDVILKALMDAVIFIKMFIYIVFYIIVANLLVDIWIMEKPISEIQALQDQ